MHLNTGDIDKLTKQAVQLFWETRGRAEAKGAAGDRGGRAGATAGKNLDGFVQIIADLIAEARIEGLVAGIEKRYVTLPGYLRPVKDWDLVLTRHGELLAVFEFKSHVGPSFGNNFNNRNEEAMGSSIDIRTAVKRGVYGESHRMPYLGWCILVEDAYGSRSPVRMSAPHFDPMKEFAGASYLDRYEIFCRQLEEEDFYSSAAVIATPKDDGTAWGEYSNMSDDTSFERFVRRFWEYLATV
ncbi:PaeR7I family type II restriction endonuclease [Arthrobacter sp. KNU40]|uniref:PaeR7I family type II restriction endonuclease n=1 Tax=Arthrobacter sp. KNU40 TaxID=3447965 RepID=UPI003F5E9068